MTTLTGKIVYFTRWGTSILLVGIVAGAMAVLFPPMASIGFVALVGVLLLWALPELRFVPEKSLRTLFFIMIMVQLCVPGYYAIDTGVLPWISVRRLFSLAVIVLFSITVAGSRVARGEIAATLRTNRLLAFATFGFLAMMFISLLTSVNTAQSLSQLVDGLLNWYVPLFACILIIRREEDVILLFKTIAVAAIIISLAGVIELILERRYYFDIFPKSILDSMLATNPALAKMFYNVTYRNGLYRASSIFSVPLSLGEFAAFVAPISAYFVLDGRGWRQRVLGVAVGICSLLAVFCSGARGGYTAILVAMPILAVLWTIRYSKLNPHSLVGGILGTFFAIGISSVFAMVAFWPRIHDMVLGNDWEGSESTDARFEQWNLALPHIYANPVTGHGMGNANGLIAYHLQDGVGSVDSYIITLLVDMGVPGVLLFFSMIAIAIWTAAYIYLTDADKRAAICGPIACCLIAFAVYRTALSQVENHNLFFIFIGLVFATSKLNYDRRPKTAAPRLRFAGVQSTRQHRIGG